MPANTDMPTTLSEKPKNLDEEILRELVLTRKLLTIMLAKLGSDSGEIGEALGLEPRRIREWVSFKGIRRMSENGDKKPSKGKERATKRLKDQTVEIVVSSEEPEVAK